MNRGLIVLAVAVFFLPTLACDFVGIMDDQRYIFENPLLLDGGWEGAARLWRGEVDDCYYHPLPITVLAWLSWLSRAALGTLSPVPFHLANMLLHAGRALLAYEIIRRVLEGAGLGPELARRERWAALGALIFALHPAQVELVAWATNLRSLMASGLAMAAWVLHLEAHRTARSAARVALRGGALGLFGLACASKPSALGAIPMVLAMDWGLLRRPLLRSALALIPWALPAVAAVLLMPHQIGEHGAPLHAATHLATASLALLFYLWKVLLPVGLSVEYPSQAWFFERIPLWLPPLGVLALASAALASSRRRTWLTLLALFAGGLAPILGLVDHYHLRITIASDRYLELSLLVLGLAVALLLVQRGRRAQLAALSVAVLLGLLSARQIRHWRDLDALIARCMEISPTCDMGKLEGGAPPK